MSLVNSPQVSFAYGTSIMPTFVNGIIGRLPAYLKPIDPRKFEDELKVDFSSNLKNSQRKGPEPGLFGRYPSVTALLGATEADWTNLYKWQTTKIEELGKEGFKRYMANRSTTGTNFHKTIECLLHELIKSGVISEELFARAIGDKENHCYIKGVIPILKMIPKTTWMKVEKTTKNHYYCYQGKFDAIVELNGKPTIVDWKTVSCESIKHVGTNNLRRLYGYPIQLVSYIASVNCDPDFASMPKITQGAIVLAYEDGRPADVLYITEKDLEEYYKILADKINFFWWRMMNAEKNRFGVVSFIRDPKTFSKDSDISEKSGNDAASVSKITGPKKYFALYAPKPKKIHYPENL